MVSSLLVLGRFGGRVEDSIPRDDRVWDYGDESVWIPCISCLALGMGGMFAISICLLARASRGVFFYGNTCVVIIGVDVEGLGVGIAIGKLELRGWEKDEFV